MSPSDEAKMISLPKGTDSVMNEAKCVTDDPANNGQAVPIVLEMANPRDATASLSGIMSNVTLHEKKEIKDSESKPGLVSTEQPNEEMQGVAASVGANSDSSKKKKKKPASKRAKVGQGVVKFALTLRLGLAESWHRV